VALLDTITANTHNRVLTTEVRIGGRQVPAATVLGIPSTSHARDQMVGTGEVELSAKPSWFNEGQSLEIRLGWNGLTAVVFKGTIPEHSVEASPKGYVVHGQGEMYRTQDAGPTTLAGLSWTNETGENIVRDCLINAGVTNYSLRDGWATLGVEEDVVLEENSAYAGLINEVDQIERLFTCDMPDGAPRRFSQSGVPSATTSWDYDEDTILDAQSSESVRQVRNRCVVEGFDDGIVSYYAARQADSIYVPDPPRYRIYTLPNSKVDSQSVADTLAELLMLEYNRKVGAGTITVLGNPYVRPGDTIGVTCSKLDLVAKTNCWVTRVSQRADPENGWTTEIGIEWGVGDAGYSTGRPPLAMFSYVIVRKTETTGMIYVVTCVNESTDPDTPMADLTLAWSNSANAVTGSGEIYVVVLTAAEMATGVTITLTVTDPEANEDTMSWDLTDEDADILLYGFHVALYGRAQSTDDSGETWQTFTPGGGEKVISTAPVTPASMGVWGGDGGSVWMSLDYLRTAPTVLHDFNSAVNAVWVNESDANRICVGLESGAVYQTIDANLGAASTWTLVHTFTSPVVEIIESFAFFGQYRISEGTTEHIWQGGTDLVGATFTTTATQVALGFDGNFASGIDSTDEAVKAELGDTATFPEAEPDVRAIAHDAKLPVLYAAARGGDFYAGDVPSAGAPPLAGQKQTSIPGATGVNRLNRIDVAKFVFACDETAGIVNSPDGGVTWFTFVAGNGTTLRGKAVGYESEPMVPIVLPVNGRRVIVAGAGSPAWCKWTDDCWADPIVWNDASTGLPNATSVISLRLEPNDNDRAYLLVDGYLYRNDDLYGVGAWAVVLDTGIIEALQTYDSARADFHGAGL